MTHDEAQKILTHISYKPLHTVELRRHDDEMFFLDIHAHLMDAEDQRRPFKIRYRKWIGWDDLAVLGEAEFISLVEAHCAAYEEHERKEWLRLDGVCLTDPHPDKE